MLLVLERFDLTQIETLKMIYQSGELITIQVFFTYMCQRRVTLKDMLFLSFREAFSICHLILKNVKFF
jgi:hypothetical protein